MTISIHCGTTSGTIEAFRVILKHENIQYENAIGAGNTYVLIIDLEDYTTVKILLKQWLNAINYISGEF